MATKTRDDNSSMSLTYEEQMTVFHYRGYCHDSQYCAACKTEAVAHKAYQDGWMAATRKVAEGR